MEIWVPFKVHITEVLTKKDKTANISSSEKKKVSALWIKRKLRTDRSKFIHHQLLCWRSAVSNLCRLVLPTLIHIPRNVFRKYFTITVKVYLDDWLTVHRGITLVDLQLDAQNSYLFTYNTFIKILYMFRALPCSSSADLRRNCIWAASGIVIYTVTT